MGAFSNPYPPEYGYYRIGTPINADLNRAAPACPSFKMSALAAESCLLTDVNPVTTKRIQGGGSDAKTQDSFGFSVDSAVKLNWFVSASVSCHVAQSNNHCSSNSALTITAYAKQESGITLRRNIPTDVLLKCATDDFRDKVLAIRCAAQEYATHSARSPASREKLIKAYKAFYAIYGTGFVSKLALGAIGIFRGSAKYDNSSDESKSNYGGGFSVSGVCGGVSAAAEYAKKRLVETANGSFEAEAFGMPAGSPVAEWADKFLNDFAGQQLSKLSDLKAWKECFDAPVAKAEPPVVKERPAKAEIPSFKAGDIEGQINDIKLNEYVDAWRKTHEGTEPDAAQYEQWIDKIKGAAEKVDISTVAKAQAKVPDEENARDALPLDEPQLSMVKSLGPHLAPGDDDGDARLALASVSDLKATPNVAALGLLGPQEHARLKSRRGAAASMMFLMAPGAKATGASDLHSLPALKLADADVHPAYRQSQSFGADSDDSTDTVDFGGYGVVGYEYTPWAEVFPELKPIAQAPTTSQLSMGLAMAWLSTRETLAQYLRFCARQFPDFAPEGLSASANAFRLAVDDAGTYIVQSFTRTDAEVLSLGKLEVEFRRLLSVHRFTLLRHYEMLLENFAWLSRLPFGAVPCVEMRGLLYFQPYYSRFNGDKVVYEHACTRKTDFPAATLLEQGALRLYPVIHEDLDGKVYFHWTNVEFVTVAGKQRKILAGLLQPPDRSRTTDLDWGMFRVDPDRFGAKELAFCQTPDMPDSLNPSSAIWSLAGTKFPPCHVLAPAIPQPAAVSDYTGSPFYYPMFDASHRLSVVGLHEVFVKGAPPPSYKAMNLVLNSGEKSHAAIDISLVPVDYADAKIAEEPASGFIGGGPMWIEPRTERIIDALHRLAD